MPGLIGSAIQRASNLTLLKALDEYKDQPWRNLATVAPSSAASEKYEWLGDLPGMREFLDARQIEGLKKHDYTILNKDWEATVGFGKSELDDNAAIIKPRLQGLAQGVQMHPNKLVFDLMMAGHTAGSLCYDGQLFFDTDHPNFTAAGAPSTDGVNYIAGAGVDTVAHISTDWYLALTAFLNTNRRRDGAPLLATIGKPKIYHAVHDTGIFRAAFKTQFLAAGVSNDLFEQAEPIPCPWLTTDSSWFIVPDGLPVRPFIFQEREAVKAEWDETQVFQTRKIFYGVSARYNVGYGLWQGAIMVYNA